MVEVMTINYILQHKSFNILNKNDLDDGYFIEYKAEFDFIKEHFNKFNIMPDNLTILAKFEDFEFIEVTESEKFLVEKLREQYAYSKLVPTMNETAKLIQEDAIKAIQYLNTQIMKLAPLTMDKEMGVDIVKNSLTRLGFYEKVKAMDGLLGITTGLKELDEIIHGWVSSDDGDLISITARPNEGKSWMMVFFLFKAWKSGKKVLMYSGEMAESMLGFRFDTFNGHYSNMGLMDGKEDLGMTKKLYKDYIDDLSKSDIPFIIITPKMLGGKRLNTNTLDMLIQKYNPDIIGIDQLSLMDDYRSKKGDMERITFSNITFDLLFLSQKYEKPIIIDNQAKRVDKGKKGTDDAPELDEIFGADAVGQNCTKVISIKQTSGGLKIAVKKNRYGLRDKEFMYFWDINLGIFNYMGTSQPENTEDNSATNVNSGSDVF